MNHLGVVVSKALTIRTDEAIYEKLDTLAKELERSRNYLANEALKAFLKVEEETNAAPSVRSAEDLAGDFWLEDDTPAFLEYLEEERSTSLKDDANRVS